MSYRTETIREVAVEGVPCGWTHGRSTCQSGKPAVHVLLKGLPVAPQGTALCAYHSPFDVEQKTEDMIEITTVEGTYGRKCDTVEFTVEGRNVYNRHHPHTVNFYSDGTKMLSAGACVISAHRTGSAPTRLTVRTGDQIKVDGVIYTIVGNRSSDPTLVEA